MPGSRRDLGELEKGVNRILTIKSTSKKGRKQSDESVIADEDVSLDHGNHKDKFKAGNEGGTSR
jgi:hypothetical protein